MCSKRVIWQRREALCGRLRHAMYCRSPARCVLENLMDSLSSCFRTCFPRWMAVVALCGVTLSGCGGEPTGPATSAPVSAETPPAEAAVEPADSPAEPAAVEVVLDLVDHEGLLERIAAAKGRVVVLDCWSTSCPPCIKEFPGLLKLQETFGDEVQCLSLSFDYEGIGEPEEVLPRVRGFLEQVGAGIPNMLSLEESDVMLTKLDLVSVPGIFVYAVDGSLSKRFDDDMASTELGRPFTYADVEAEVRTLLGK